MVDVCVERRPDAIAAIDGERTITYRGLDRHANQLAHALRARGVGIGALVGVCCEPSLEQLVAVLGVLKAGGAYVPIEPDYPAVRIAQILADARPAVVVVDRERGLAGELRVDGVLAEPTAPPEVSVGSDDAIYVLYTSGSTGVPKGVVALHRAISNRLRWGDETFPLAPGEIACARTPLSFVDSVAEIFGPLAAGAPLVIVGRDARRDLTCMIDLLAVHGVTRIVVVPSLLAALLELDRDLASRLPHLALWFVGGEPVPPPLVERFARALPGRRLINIYGSTEVSGDATYFDFDRMPAGLATSPIGTPIAGAFVRILDDDLRETEVGEVCVSGVCLARGYLDRSELTAARFVANPFPEGGRLYRMGDLGRRLASGDIQYLGRVDQLVKIRGMRVELGEVEARLLELPGVTAGVAVARDDRQGGRTLAAFYTGTASAAELRAGLALRLPAYMVPTDIVPLDALPTTATGKIDRRALAARPIAQATTDPPATADERRVARVWEDVLERSPIGRTHDFFELGGTSLSAVRIIARLRDELGIAIPLTAIFAHPTVAALATHLRALAGRAIPRPVPVTDRPLPASLPLTSYQYPFWLFRALTGDVSVVADVFAFADPVDVPRLQRAFSDTVSAFDALWMRFPRWRPVQQLAPRRPYALEVRDRRTGDDAGVLADEVRDNITRRFALADPPHVHARLIRLPSGAHRLAVAIPHVAADMTAFELFRTELESRYTGRGPVAPRGASLLDVVDWERGGDDAGDRRYWRELGIGDAWNEVPVRLRATRHARALARRELGPAFVADVTDRARDLASSLPIAMISAISAGLLDAFEREDLRLLLMIEKRDRPELRTLFATMTALMPLAVRRSDSLVAIGHRLLASYDHTDHMMAVPTLWNDSWASAPAIVRRTLTRIASRLAPWLFALVPDPRRRDAIMVCVNVLPEVVQPQTGAIASTRSIELMLRPSDLVTGSDALLDRTLQIHVTRERDAVVVNFYGGRIHQCGLDEIADRIMRRLEAMARGEAAA
jgi:amino acid adenylation domain-containing protein